MKKLFIGCALFLFLGISGVFTENQKKQLEDCADFYVIRHSGYDKKDSVILDKALAEGKFVLYTSEETFFDYMQSIKKSRHTKKELFSDIDNTTLDELKEILKREKTVYHMVTSDYYTQKVYEKGPLFITEIFYTDNNSGNAFPVGTYSMNVFYENGRIQYFELVDPGCHQTRKELLDNMTEYVRVSKDPYRGGIMWKNEEAIEQFFNDMVAKKSSLPKYVIHFQEVWEEIINSLEE